jgi:murein DD-endopeptidase MepM/ murein hydrolase activator NlpD
MSEQDPSGIAAGRSRAPLILAVAVLAVVMAGCMGLVVVAGGAGGGAAAAQQDTQGSNLRPDAPVPPQYLAWVLRAGALCPKIGPAEIAAQIDLESSWNPNAVAHNPPERGGDAMGIAQFQAGTWKTWGGDRDEDGRNSPYDPEDAILAQGHLMCDLVDWATQNVASGRLRGDVLDLAWAAYFCGRGCVLDAGGVPAAGLSRDYPGKVRARLAKYAAADGGVPVGPGGWTLPLKPGTYSVGSGFGMRWGRLHAGVDLMARTGTPIYATAAGTVLDAGCTSAYCDRPGSMDVPGCGLRINIGHGGEIVTRYCHAVRLSVRDGDRVAAGQIIAWVGSTGHSSGPHLHFEVHRGAPPATNKTAKDPMAFLRTVGLRP